MRSYRRTLAVMLALAAAPPAAASTLGVGETQSCALRATGSVVCSGQFDLVGTINGVDDSLTPVAVDGIADAVDLSTGTAHACAVLADGTVRCWGDNTYGQIGDGTTAHAYTPQPVAGLTDAVAVAAGRQHSCAIHANGAVACWGKNTYTSGSFQVTKAVDIDAGSSGTCVVEFGGEVACWGAIAQPPTFSDARQVAVGNAHACVLRAGGHVTCWGSNSEGQLGTGDTSPQPSGVEVPGLSGVTQLSAGDFDTCALLPGGTVSCWGYNGSGQLGTGDQADHLSPTPVPSLSGVTEVSAGFDTTCARLASGSARCWGHNQHGQAGDGASSTSAAPVTVTGAAGATSLSGGLSSFCAVVSGTVKCWGTNTYGQLGDGTYTERGAPTAVTGVSGATQVATALFATHACALLGDHSVSCWGANDRGELGDGGTTSRPTAATVPAVSATQLAVGQNHACVVTTAATPTVVCWGDRWDGVNFSAVPTPTSVSGTDNAVQVTSGEFTDCVLIAGGAVKCWGGDDLGELGDGNGHASSVSPVSTGITNATAIRQIGTRSTCALVPGPAVKCWGQDYGDAPTTVAGTVFPASNDPTLSACTLASGTVSCTGDGNMGQLGDGLMPAGHYPYLLSPDPVSNLTDVRDWPGPRRPAASDFEVAPTSLAFSATAVGATSAPLTVTVTNVSGRYAGTYFSATAPTPDGDFSQTASTCGASLAPGGSCTLSYDFHPGTTGDKSAAASVGLVDTAVPITLTGRALTGFVITPGTTTFPDTAVGATSAPMALTVLNASGTTRTLDLAISGLGDDFSATSACAATLGPGESCSLSATFHPTEAGARTATPSVRLTGTDNPFTLAGNGIGPTTPGGGAAFTITGAKVKSRHRIALMLSVPAAGRVRAVARTKIKRRKLTYARRSATVHSGATALTLSPSKAARAALKHVRRAHVTIRVTFTPATGRATTRTARVTVKH